MPPRASHRVARVFVAVAAATTVAVGGIGAARPAGAATVRVSVGDSAVVEGQMTHRYVKFPITLSHPAGAPVTVNYTTANDTATAGPDYKVRTGSVVFGAGQTTKAVAVTVWPDRVDEDDETFSFSITSVTGAAVARGTGTGTIFDDDPNAGPRVGIGDVVLPEVCTGKGAVPRANVVLTMSIMQSAPVTVHVETADGTATAGVDYSPVSQNITFSSSQNTKEVRVPINRDIEVEGDETLTVSVTVISGSVGIQRSTGTVTILDCDPTA